MKSQKSKVKSQKDELSLREAQRRSNPLVIFAVALLSLAGLVFLVSPARAVGENCFIFDNLDNLETLEEVQAASTSEPPCAFFNNEVECVAFAQAGNKDYQFFTSPGPNTCQQEFENWESEKALKIQLINAAESGVVPLAPGEEIAGYCFCATKLEGLTPEMLQNAKEGGCQSFKDADDRMCQGGGARQCQFFSDGPDIGQQSCEYVRTKWNADAQKMGKIVSSAQKSKSRFLPACILADDLPKDSPCRDVGIFIVLGIEIANYLFTIVGALALLMFIYGGVMFIISEGNPERVKKGADAMLAAVIGLVVVFSAYLLVGFLSEAVGVSSKFQL